MKSYRGSYQHQVSAIYQITLKIAYIQFAGYDRKFRIVYDLPAEGYQGHSQKELIDRWTETLFSDKNKHDSFQKDLRKLAKWAQIDDSELPVLEGYLVSGEPLVVPIDMSRLKTTKNSETGSTELWLRIDGLSKQDILKEIHTALATDPDLIPSDQWVSIKEWRLFMIHKQVYVLRQQGLTDGKIAEMISKRMRDMPDSDPEVSMSSENVRRIVSDYKKRMEAYMAKREKLIFETSR